MLGRIIVVLAVVALVVVFVLSGGGRVIGLGTGPGMPDWGAGPAAMMGWNGSGFSNLGIAVLLVGALVIVGVLRLLSLLLRPGRPAIDIPLTGSSRPLDILNERYARGEITRADYNRMREEVAS